MGALKGRFRKRSWPFTISEGRFFPAPVKQYDWDCNSPYSANRNRREMTKAVHDWTAFECCLR
ncbi:MAG: hypothetical protein DWH91_02200 [Planctomycetota bacterium]|nr:MAG: hypothetical protein DWH91_02200 [Planctomycetota bacterium]